MAIIKLWDMNKEMVQVLDHTVKRRETVFLLSSPRPDGWKVDMLESRVGPCTRGQNSKGDGQGLDPNVAELSQHAT